MSNNINWTGNKVLNSNTTRPATRPAYNTPTEPDLSYPMSAPEMQHGEDMMSSPAPFREGPPPSAERGYIPYFLASNIGKIVRAEFIIGTNQYFDKVGTIIEVGINYFVLDDAALHHHVMCDLYSVKFVTLLRI